MQSSEALGVQDGTFSNHSLASLRAHGLGPDRLGTIRLRWRNEGRVLPRHYAVMVANAVTNLAPQIPERASFPSALTPRAGYR